MSLQRSSIVMIAALTVGGASAMAQDSGLRRLSPPTATAPSRRPAPQLVRPAVQQPARSPAASPPAPSPAPVSAPSPAARAPAASPAASAGPITTATPRPAATPPAPPIGARPVIIIDSRRIGDPTGPVLEVSRASRQVMQEFGPRTQELMKLKAEADKTQTASDAARGRDKETLAAKARLQKAEFDTRNAALEKEFKARNETLLSPIQVRINESLKAFALAQGAVIVLDGARFNGAVLAMKAGTDPASLDMTTVFIDSYNRAHP